MIGFVDPGFRSPLSATEKACPEGHPDAHTESSTIDWKWPEAYWLAEKEAAVPPIVTTRLLVTAAPSGKMIRMRPPAWTSVLTLKEKE